MRSTTSGVSSQESDEQQRNWTKQHWKKKAKDSLSNYDPTRAKLNFEVIKGGIIQPIDTSKTIDIKQKGISTMITNLQARKDDIQTQIDQIAKQLGQSGADNDELANKIALLRKEMEGIDEKLAVRYKMLDDANDTINEAKARLAEMRNIMFLYGQLYFIIRLRRLYSPRHPRCIVAQGHTGLRPANHRGVRGPRRSRNAVISQQSLRLRRYILRAWGRTPRTHSHVRRRHRCVSHLLSAQSLQDCEDTAGPLRPRH